MPDLNLNPDALLKRIAEVIDSECETYGAAVDGSPGELLYGDGTDLPIEAARKVMDVIRPHLASALPAQPDRFDSRELNRQGLHCGLCEPGEYENCHHCAKACDELADFLNRNYPAPSDTVNSVEEIPAKIQIISWEEEPEHECWKLAPDETFVGLIVKADRSWSPADQYTLNISRPVEG